MKKVLFVATVVKLHIMVFHIPYLEWFKKNGYEVHVAARNDYENKNECNIPFCDKFYDLPFERMPIKINNYFVYRKLKRIIQTNQYEIIHCHTPIGGVLTRVATRKARKNGTKVIYTAHGFHFYKGAPLINWLVYYPVERWLARYTDVLITINEEDYCRAKKLKAGKVEYIPGVGIDINKFENVKINRKEKRESIGIKDDEFMIISVGELNKNKNHQVIIKALAELKNCKIRYVICGQGPLEDKLRTLAQKLKVENQVKLLGFRKDIVELLGVADLFVFPSLREGLSLSLMEAMASGLPIVCSNIRGNTDLVKEFGGYLVDVNDIHGWKNSIEKALTSDGKIKGDFNRKLISSYNQNRIMRKMERIYNLKN